MLCINSAYSNIVKDPEWFKKSLGLSLVFVMSGIMCFVSGIMNSADPKTISGAISMLCLVSVSSILSILSSLVLGGYTSVYLRNLLADENSNLPEWKIYLKEVVIAGLKLYVFFIAVYIAFLFVALVIGGIFAGIAFLFSMFVGTYSAYVFVIFVILLTLLGITLSLFYIPLQMNFAAKNLELSALFDFKSALKYFCKDYYTYLLWLGLFSIGIIILIIIALIPVMLASHGTSAPYEFMGICYILFSPVMSLFLLICTNLIAQIYYSRLDKITI